VISYLSLGSNIGDRRKYLQTAVARLQEAGVPITRVSSVYETEPVENADQAWFLNIVAETVTSVEPLDLLTICRQVESVLRRERRVDKGPRTLDIDILTCGTQVSDSPNLTLPHPRMCERRFVLEPLAELEPNLVIPGSANTVSEALAALSGQQVRRVGSLDEDT